MRGSVPRAFLAALAAFGATAWAPPQAPSSERGLPLVRNVSPAEHGGRAQSFAVTEDHRGLLYVGNLKGLLEFDGARWRTIALPNDSAAFAVAPARDGRVYVGGWDELGALGTDSAGKTVYASLVERIPKGLRPLGRVRAVHAVETSVCFRTESRLFLWDGAAMRVVPAAPGGSFGSSFEAGDGEVWVQAPEGLARVTPGGLEPLPDAIRFAGEHVEAVVPKGNGTRLVVVRGRGVFLIEEGSARPVGPEAARWLDSKEVVAGALLPDGRVALATRRAGVAVLGADLALDETAGTVEGLPGDDVLALHVARDGALWAALDTGLSRVELASPVSVFDRRTGVTGTVLSVARHRGRIVVSSTEGLFALGAAPSGAARRYAGRFTRVDGVGPGCFATASAGEDLLVATRAGLFVAGPGGIDVVPGTEKLAVYVVVPSLRFPGRFWLGLPDGIGLLRRDGRTWLLERFNQRGSGPVRTIVEEAGGDGAVWLGSVFGGVLRLRFAAGGVPQVTPAGSPAEVSLFASRDGVRAVVAGKGLFRVDPATPGLVAEQALAAVARDENLFLAAEDGLGNVWLNTAPPSFAIRRDGRLIGERRVVSEIRGSDFQALVALDDTVWLGSEEGLFRYDVSASHPLQPLPAPLVRRVLAGRGPLVSSGAHGGTPSDAPTVPASAGRLRFECAPRTHFVPIAFQFLLEGAESDWSDPGPEAAREYTNLREGAYTLRVRTLDPQGRTSPETLYGFRVLPPWHRGPAALALWVALGVAAIVGSLQLRHRTLRRRNELLRSSVEERTRALADAVAELDAARAQLEERNVDLASANEQLTSLSYLDALTGLPNRRHFDETLQREWNRSARSGSDLSVVMVDVDHFKKLNDLLGHAEGDRCLKELAQVLSSGAARAGDLAARYGGEEFVVLLPQTTADGAAHLAEGLRQRTEALGLANPGSPFGIVTASFGVSSTVPRDGGTPAELLAAADEALYDAKASGRNRVAEG